MSQLIERVLDVLELLASRPAGMALSDLCRDRKLPKVTAHRVLSTMVERGFVEQDKFSERYRLTLKTTAIGFQFLAETRITDLCQPILDKVAVKTGELARLAIADGDSLTWVAKSQGALSGLKYDPNMGHPVVLHATAVGRAWLATLEEAKALRIVRARGFAVPDHFHRCSVTDEAMLRAELDRIRKRGYGLAREEGEAGMAAVGCAVFDPFDPTRAVATVSVAGPIVRMTSSRIPDIAAILKVAAGDLSSMWPMRQFALGTSSPVDEPTGSPGNKPQEHRGSGHAQLHRPTTTRRK